MQKSMKVLVPTIAASVVLSACGSSSSSKTTSSAENQPPASQASAAGTSSTQVKTAVSQLNDDELARLQSRTEKVQRDLAAGSLTNQELTYIIIALATAVIVILILKA